MPRRKKQQVRFLARNWDGALTVLECDYVSLQIGNDTVDLCYDKQTGAFEIRGSHGMLLQPHVSNSIGVRIIK